MMRRHDPIGRYFRLFREEMGASTEIEVTTYRSDESIHLDHVDHAISDGQGALLRISETRGEAPLQLPKQSSDAIPNLFKQICLLLKYLKTMEDPLDSTLKRSKVAFSGATFSFHCFQIEQSSSIVLWCKSQGISPTAFLMWTLHKSIGIQSGIGDHNCRWSVPVSLRGPLETDVKANYAVPLFLNLNAGVLPQDVHTLLSAQLKTGLPWGAYRMLVILAALPSRLYKKIIRLDEEGMEAKGKWFAVFSNVGAIEGDKDILYRTLSVPTNTAAPLKASCLTWNGRLTLNLGVHNSMLPHSIDADTLMSCWKNTILSSICLIG